MQAAYELAQAREHEHPIKVQKFARAACANKAADQRSELAR